MLIHWRAVLCVYVYDAALLLEPPQIMYDDQWKRSLRNVLEWFSRKIVEDKCVGSSGFLFIVIKLFVYIWIILLSSEFILGEDICIIINF